MVSTEKKHSTKSLFRIHWQRRDDPTLSGFRYSKTLEDGKVPQHEVLPFEQAEAECFRLNRLSTAYTYTPVPVSHFSNKTNR